MGASRLHTAEYKALCRLLRQWRISADLTQRDLAEKLEKPCSYVHKCESGSRRMDPIEFLRWAAAANLPISQATEMLEKIIRWP